MRNLLFVILLLINASICFAQGLPRVVNFTEKDYNAHSRNFDITIDSAGIVWVANFEGLIYFDNSQWHTIHIPGFARSTVVYSDQKGAIWTGGYNFFGKVEIDAYGSPFIKQIEGAELYQGEIQEIWEKDGKIKFLVDNGNVCIVDGGKAVFEKKIDSDIVTGLSDIIDIESVEKNGGIKILDDIIVKEDLNDNLFALLTKNSGIQFVDSLGTLLYTLDENNGLINNNISYISYNNGVLWGAGEKNIFAVRVPSPNSLFTAKDGLNGSVVAIGKYNQKMYAGTFNGLFVLENRKFKKINNIPPCWAFTEIDNQLVCATSGGIFTLDGKRFSNTSTLSLYKIDDNSFLAGCVDGVYLFKIKEKISAKICPLEKVISIKEDNNGTIWVQSLYGQIWTKSKDNQIFEPYNDESTTQSQSTIAIVDGKALIINAEDKIPFEYPMFSHYDYDGIAWLTDYTSRNLYRWRDGHPLNDRVTMLWQIKDLQIRAFYKEEGKIWLGSEDGIVVLDFRAKDPAFDEKPKLKIRKVVVGNDSIVWGGFGNMPTNLGVFESNERRFKFEFSLDCFVPSKIVTSQFRYRINNNQWSNYSSDYDAEFLNLHYGNYELEIQGKSIYNIETEPVKIQFVIKKPFYMRWYSWLFYAFVLWILVMIFLRLRMRRLQLEKVKLEKLVYERTAEVVKQRDEIVKQKNEIEIKSNSLEEALEDLSKAQNALIRQEKMATVGKLTQGLIDRILNPLNYINNFSKLSESLVKDIEANIEDEKVNMDEENYEDTLDVLNMLKGNLQKVSEHGQNTTRTLKAMEEMLKDRSGGMVKIDLAKVLRKNEEVVSKYHEQCINKYSIKVDFSLPEEGMPFEGNPDLLSKTFMSIINNGFYAVVKKADRESYPAEIAVCANAVSDKYIIKFRDNGIGIEQTIIDKVFDPFFTTKPTGEASGVGLYLSREIIQNHHGEIFVESEKDKFTEFTVVFDK